MSDSPQELSRLRWRCRRGMRELDVMLERWLRVHWSEAPPEQRAAFQRLLDCEDDLLWSWLSGRELPEDDQLRCLVNHIAG